jgi:uncharacterized protein (DUF2062 family)
MSSIQVAEMSLQGAMAKENYVAVMTPGAAESLFSVEVLEETHFLRRCVVGPVLQLLRIGATPERLAWSIAVGLVIGVNPLLGSTTLVAFAAASMFGLNLVGSQFANHLMYPLELVMFPVFIRLGTFLFRTAALPLGYRAMFHAVKLHPWDTTRFLWNWEWHALVVWAVFAVIVAPLLQMGLKIVLVKMLNGLHHEPVMEK